MATRHSTAGDRPAKPYDGFPLGWHPSGYWCKRIRGKLHYFGGRNATWQEALAEYQGVRDDLHAGRKPRESSDDDLTVRYLCNAFLTDRKHRLETGELTQVSFTDYRRTCERLVKQFGHGRRVDDLRSDDFLKLRSELADGWSPKTLANEIQRVRTVFNFAWQTELIDRPVRFGPSFRRPSQRVMRQWRQSKGERLFTPEQLRDILDAASCEMRAMIYLGINCGFGNGDCARLPIDAVNLESGWLTFPRPKTGVLRKCYLWQATRVSLRNAIRRRRTPNADIDKGLLFISRKGSAWHHIKRNSSGISHKFRVLLDALKVYRPGLSFYTLRHTFRTIADETKDQPAIDHIMGHADPSMAGHYRERILDDRLRAVAMHVHGWLYGEEAQHD